MAERALIDAERSPLHAGGVSGIVGLALALEPTLSPTGLQRVGGADARLVVHHPSRIGRTAIVIREIAQIRPSESVMSTSQTHVVRPRWRGVACAVM